MKTKGTPKTVAEVYADLECEGFMVQAATSSQRAVVMKKTAAHLPGEWEAIPLGEKGTDFILKPRDGGLVSKEFSWDRADQLSRLEGVREAEPALASDQRVQVSGKKPAAKSSGDAPDLPCAASNELWSLEMMDVAKAWELAPPSGGRQLGQGIRIGHPDTGYRPHPELISGGLIRADLGFNFEENNANPLDPLSGKSPGHGTATASVIMSPRGVQLNGQPRGVSGIAPRAELVPFRVSDSVVHFSMANVTQAIHAAIDAGCHVVSMSLGGPFSSNALERAVARARDQGVILLAAAGNVWPFVVAPARLDDVLAVAACNCMKKPWNDSAKGKEVNVTAPGESVWRAKVAKDGAYSIAPSSGTSYAVASTAGVCALWLAFHGRDRLLQKYGPQGMIRVFEQLLMATTKRPSGWETENYGTGIVNANALLSRALPASAPSVAEAKSAASARASELVAARLTRLFPEASSKAVQQAVSACFGISTEALPGLASELAFHLMDSPRLAAEVRRTLSTPAAKATKAAKAKSATASSVLARHPSVAVSASARLREAISTARRVAATPPKVKTAKPKPAAPAEGVRVDKAIITAWGVLKHKYGKAGCLKVQGALDRLVKADAKRGLQTRLFDLQDAALLEELGLSTSGGQVTTPEPEKAKAVVDAICTAHHPDYVLLLGGPDVVPYIPLANPLSDDPDGNLVPSDLPYASDRPYATDAQIFRAPTRVVGRLPDVRGASKPDFLLAALKQAATWKTQAASVYNKAAFGLSTESWQSSTRENMRLLFGPNADPHLSPPSSPLWKKSDLAVSSHFINCHGDTDAPQYLGESEDDANDQPEALHSDRLVKRITPGAIIAAECCYGAELYDPQIEPGVPEMTVAPAIANRYLEQGAWAYVGSTNIAYGPASGMGEADWICHFFFKHILAGASTGRAMLQARLDFVKKVAPLSQTEVKTLAQFVLLGDPSITPVKAASGAGSGPKAKGALAKGKTAAKITTGGGAAGRAQRRELLVQESRALRTQAGRSQTEKMSVSPAIKKMLLEKAGIEKSEISIKGEMSLVHTSHVPAGESVSHAKSASKPGAKSAAGKTAKADGSRQYILIGECRDDKPAGKPEAKSVAKSAAKSAAPAEPEKETPKQKAVRRYLQRGVVLIAQEVGGKMQVRKVYPH